MKIFPLTLYLLFSFDFAATNKITNLNTCLTSIIRKYFRGESVRLYLTEELCVRDGHTPVMMKFEGTCFDYTGISTMDATFEIATTAINFTKKAINTILFANGSDLSDVSNVIAGMKMTSQWRTRVLVVLYDGDEGKTKELIFSEIWRKTRLINTVILNISDDDNFTFYSWYPYEKGSCESFESVRLLERWHPGGFEGGKYLFPRSKILQGLNNCPVLATTMPSHFFTTYKGVPDENSDGLDLRIVREIVKKYSVRITYKMPPSGWHHWNRTDDFGQLYGSMKLLHDYEIELAFSGMKIIPEVVPYLPISHVYFIETLQWSVPKAHVNDGWKKMVSVFPVNLWIAVFVTLVSCGIFMHFLNRFENKPGPRRSYSYCLLESLSLTLTHPIVQVPRSFVIRSFLFGYLFYAYNISISYQSLLIGILTAPSYDNPFKSLKDAFERGLNIYFFPLIIPLYKNDTLGEQILESGQFRLAYNAVAIIREMVHNKSAAVILGNARVRYLIAQEFHDKYGNPLIDSTKEIITRNLIAFHFSPNSPLKELFDEVIFHLIQGGFMNKWKLDLLTPKKLVDDDEDDIKALTMENLLGIFQMFGISIGISTLIFICEISSKWFKKYKK